MGREEEEEEEEEEGEEGWEEEGVGGGGVTWRRLSWRRSRSGWRRMRRWRRV